MSGPWLSWVISGGLLGFGLVGVGLVGIVAIATILVRLRQAFATVPKLVPAASFNNPSSAKKSVVVIIPVYNEALNVVACASRALIAAEGDDGAARPDLSVQVVVIDDQSSDDTLALITAAAEDWGDPRLQVWQAPPRPVRGWVGKNWACAQAIAQLSQSLAPGQDPPDYLLFIDCDVQLQPGAIAAAVAVAETSQAGLVSVCPDIICGCWAEWLVQPVMMTIMAAGYNYTAVNDPTSPKAFAAGPFMLFRYSAYTQLGGHAAVASEVVEDVVLGHRVKAAGLGLRLCFSGGLVKVRMYQDTASLWEGWTKNWFLALDRDWGSALYSVAVLLVVYVWPWLLLALGLLTMGVGRGQPWWLVVGLVGVVGQLAIRWQLALRARLPMRYWWLGAAGGLMTIGIIFSSAYRTSTGKGWTWRGRSLQQE